jgi:hypothetical protein
VFGVEDVVDGAEVWVGDSTRQKNFLFKTLASAAAALSPLQEGFESDVFTLEVGVLNLVDFAHAAAGDKSNDGEPFGDDFALSEAGRLRRPCWPRRKTGNGLASGLSLNGHDKAPAIHYPIRNICTGFGEGEWSRMRCLFGPGPARKIRRPLMTIMFGRC